MQAKENKSSFPKKQAEFTKKVSLLLKERFENRPKACVITFGCQQNISDSERIKGILCSLGYDLTDDVSLADFVLFNTCAVREHAEDRVYGNVGAVKKYKKEKPDMIIAVCGCMAQQERVAEKFKKSYPYVDIVFGTATKHKLPEYIYNRLTGSKRIFDNDLEAGVTEDIPVKRDGSFKGFVPIMYGCDNFCSYCIVPYVRGREHSRESADIIKEVTEMVNSGFKEIMLLGQNVNSYGKGLSEKITFADLLYKINAIKGDFRIRFMTSHPKDCTDSLLTAMSECEKVERHLHLPFQSGSDRVLGAMNRKYDRHTYLSRIKKARELMPDIQFTSDIIVGFPGETYEDFTQTLSLVNEVKFASLFTFIYSKRPNTPAAVMQDNISREQKGIWFDELLRLQDKISKEINTSLIGKTFRVLVEAEKNDGVLEGKASNGLSIEFSGDKSLIGTFRCIKITEYTNVLSGILV